MRHGVRRRFIYSCAAAFRNRRNTKAETFVAAWLVPFEWPREVSCAAQRGISWHPLVIQADKHTVVMRRTFIEDAFGNTIADHVNADSPALQVQLYMMCSAGACREHKLLLLCSFGLRHIAWSFLFQHISHRLQKRHTFHMDEIVQRAFPSYIPAFPVPQAGALADLKLSWLRSGNSPVPQRTSSSGRYRFKNSMAVICLARRISSFS